MLTDADNAFLRHCHSWVFDQVSKVDGCITFTFISDPDLPVNRQRVLLLQHVLPELEARGYICRLMFAEHHGYVDLIIMDMDHSEQHDTTNEEDDIKAEDTADGADDAVTSDDDDDDDVDTDTEDESALFTGRNMLRDQATQTCPSSFDACSCGTAPTLTRKRRAAACHAPV